MCANSGLPTMHLTWQYSNLPKRVLQIFYSTRKAKRKILSYVYGQYNMTDVRSMTVMTLGGPLVAKLSKSGAIGGNELWLKVRACGLNFADLLMIKGEYQEKQPLPFVPGMEICGVIEAVGAKVQSHKPGDRVACVVGQGGLASHISVPAEICVSVPANLSDSQAAGFQIAYGTSHLALTRRARLCAGETIVVLGAAGGVGLTAVEIANQLGARVIADARGTKKLAIAHAAGADVTIDSDAPNLKERLKSEGPINVVYDSVGGSMGEAAISAIAPEGRYLIIGFASGDLPHLRPNHLLVKNIDVIGFYWGGYVKFDHAALRDSMRTLLEWAAEGRIKPHVSHVLPLEQAEKGLDLLRNRTATGKVVITP